MLPMCYNRPHRQAWPDRVSLKLDIPPFSSLHPLVLVSLMSDSNLLSRIDSVRARLVPLRDGL